ncbi:MAG: transketolase family protein [Dehalococcoidia bacterium]
MAEASTREAYGRTLVELGRQNKQIVVLDADVAPSTMTAAFAREFADRFFNCGLTEQNMIGIGAGLAASGKIVFASTFVVFVVCRCFDQLRLCISQPNLNVKIVATHGGITVGEDGSSHHGIEDLALTCALPSFTVIVPADAIEAAEAVKAAASHYGPFYIRLSRPKTPIVYPEGYHFTLGKAVTMRQGTDATVIAAGIMVAKALEASDILAREGVECRVINVPTLKPLDEAAIIKAASETGAIVVAEEHLAQGGLGSRVSQVVAAKKPVPMEFVNLGDRYALSGKAQELLQRYGLTAAAIAERVKSVVKRK